MCNNSPAESTSPENGWRSSVAPIPGRRVEMASAGDTACRRAQGCVLVCCAGWCVSPAEAGPGADLGGSSNYSNENFEGRSGEGFHVNSIWTWVSRS